MRCQPEANERCFEWAALHNHRPAWLKMRRCGAFHRAAASTSFTFCPPDRPLIFPYVPNSCGSPKSSVEGNADTRVVCCVVRISLRKCNNKRIQTHNTPETDTQKNPRQKAKQQQQILPKTKHKKKTQKKGAPLEQNNLQHARTTQNHDSFCNTGKALHLTMQ